MGSHFPRNKSLKPYSSQLRKSSTPEEKHLWYDFLQKHSVRFSRQRIIGSYILDFFCHSAMLAVELDGAQHYEPEGLKHDSDREAYLKDLGIKVLRFFNYDIDRNFEGVCREIDSALKAAGVDFISIFE